MLTAAPPRTGYRTWFVDDLHVSVGARSLEAQAARRAEPADWSLGFAVDAPALWVWSTARAASALGDPPRLTQPPAEPELEDFVEAVGKALRAAGGLALRVPARCAGEWAVPLLRELGPAPAVASRLEAVEAALRLAVAPEGWPDDLPVLLGLVPADDRRVREAVDRAARGVLRLLRQSGAAPAQPELGRYLHDGTLERHLGFA